ncbi:MAG: hypothetical protein ACK56W_12885 [Pirellula sp.]|jgi:hypothetical protein
MLILLRIGVRQIFLSLVVWVMGCMTIGEVACGQCYVPTTRLCETIQYDNWCSGICQRSGDECGAGILTTGESYKTVKLGERGSFGTLNLGPKFCGYHKFCYCHINGIFHSCKTGGGTVLEAWAYETAPDGESCIEEDPEVPPVEEVLPAE